MKERKTIKHKQFSIDEKNQIVLLYFDQHMGPTEIIRTYKLSSKSVFWRWVKQYKEFGTCIDNRGRATQLEAPKKGRPKKYVENLAELNKEELIEKVKMYQDIKKSLVYLMKQQSNNTIK